MNGLDLDFALLRATVREAAELALSFKTGAIAHGRKDDGSPVSEADHAVDQLLAARLRTARPDYGWLSEESAPDLKRHGAQRTFILDPIDGTRDFLRGGKDWTVAISIIEEGTPILAVIANPARDETYEARAGRGAYLNGRRIFASKASHLEGARIVVSRSAAAKNPWRGPWPGAVLTGANALAYRLALVASGEADVAFALNPKWEWDIAAGALLVSEAGGAITSASGAPLQFNSPEAKVSGFIAAAPKLHPVVVERLRKPGHG
jgi:myo-inositol-1(or 4)-monophosphatase